MIRQPDPETPKNGGNLRNDLVRNGRSYQATPELAEFVDRDFSSHYQSGSETSGIMPVSIAGLLARKWLILGIFFTISVISIPLIWTLIKPMYRSTAVVQVSPVVSRIVFKTEDNGIVPLYRSYLNTQVSIIRSPTVLQRVLDHNHIRNSFWYKEEGKRLLRSPLTPLECLTEALNVRPRPNTELIDVSMNTRRAADAQHIVETVVTEYKEYIYERLRSKDTHVLETLRKTYAALQNEIEGLVKTKYNLSKRIGTLDSLDLRSRLSAQLSELEAQHNQLCRNLEVMKWQLEKLSEEESTHKNKDASTSEEQKDSFYAYDQEWRQLDLQVKDLNQQLEIARQQFGESHPRIQQLLTSIKHAEQFLREREMQLDILPIDASNQQAIDPNLSMISADKQTIDKMYNAKQLEAKLLKEDIEQQRTKIEDVSEIAQQIAFYEEEIAHKRDRYILVRDRLEALEMESKAPARIKIVSFGLIPSSPTGDRRLLLTLMAIAGAGIISLTTGYLRSMTDTRIREANDVRHTIQIPFLGRLPILPSSIIPHELGGRSSQVMSESAHTLARASTHYTAYACHTLIENIRMIRTSLLERVSATGEQVVLITSPVSRTGKSSIVVLLAKSLSLLRKKVLVIEGDLRNPCLADRLEIKSPNGLAKLLSGDTSIQEAISKPLRGGFDVIPVGEIPKDIDPEYLANGVFANCIAEWRKIYNFIIIDSPPVLPVADARILAEHADGTIMVLKSSHDRHAKATEAYAQLSTGNCRLLGTVLIGGKYEKDYNYSYQYKYKQATSKSTENKI